MQALNPKFFAKRITTYLTLSVFQNALMITAGLVAIIWLTQALRFVDLVLSKGLPIHTFFSLTFFLTPDLLVTLFPFGLLFGSALSYYRLQGDSEITVLKALGASSWKIIQGPVLLSILLAALMIYANFVLLPSSFRYFKDQEYMLRQSEKPIFIRSGVFQTFGKMMVYVRETTSDGVLKGILVYDGRSPENSMTYTANKAIWVMSKNNLRLMLLEGTQQKNAHHKAPPSVLQFDEYYLDLSQSKIRPREGARKPFELDFQDLISQKKTPKIFVELHRRIIQPLLSVVFVLLGLTLAIKAPYNRRSHTRPMVISTLTCLSSQLIVLLFINRSEENACFIWLSYAFIISLLSLSTLLLKRKTNLRFFQCLGG